MKIQGLSIFLQKEAEEESGLLRSQLMACIRERERELTEGLTFTFQEACRLWAELPKEQKKPVEYVQFSLSRADALLKKEFYHTELFSRELYAGGCLCSLPVPMDWMYGPFFSYCDRIASRSRRYIGQIGKPELQQIGLSGLWICHRLMAYLLEKAMADVVRTKEYASLPDAAAFHVSHYRGEFQVLYVKQKERDQWMEWLSHLNQRQPLEERGRKKASGEETVTYYRICQDPDIPNQIRPKALPAGKADHTPVFLRGMVDRPDSYAYFLPFIEQPNLLISAEVKELWERYDGSWDYRPCALGNVEQKKIQVYWLAFPKWLDCLSDQSEYGKDGSLKQIVLRREAVENRKLAAFQYRHRSYFLVEKEILEKMLQSHIHGFLFTEVKVQQV